MSTERNPPMNTEHDRLSAGACMRLPTVAIDRYFLANGNTDRFEPETAKAICARCPVKALCLTQAIAQVPPAGGVVAGQSADAIKQLHREAIAGTPIPDLVDRTLDT